jgi:uncharacterized membrane-anchored protein
MQSAINDKASKVPEITFGFWLLKIAATTLGETGGDAVSMSLGLGYLVGTCIFAAFFIGFVIAQVRAAKLHPWLYWATIVATTTVGTTLADFADRSVGLGYPGGASLLLVLLVASLATWRATTGTVSMRGITSPRAEAFYWVTVMFSQTLGTALGDWTADTAGLGYLGSAMIFGGILLVTAAAYFWTAIPRTVLFWIAFVVTRPLGAVLGDFLDKPVDEGGLAFSRLTATLVLVAFMALGIWLLPQRPARGTSAA